MACLLWHKWDGRVCKKCGKMRNEGHKWNGCRCTLCGITREQNHAWNKCKCTICGKKREGHHEWAVSSGLCACIHCNEKITLKDVELISDQSILGVIAKGAYSGLTHNPCSKALDKLTDQKILADLIINASGSYDLTDRAFDKLTDQAMILHVVKTASVVDVRIEATGKLTDLNLIQEAKSRNSDKVCRALELQALSLTDQDLLVDIVKNGKDDWVCCLAAKKVTDKSKLNKHCKNFALDSKFHDWIDTGDCKKKCAICDRAIYNHKYEQTLARVPRGDSAEGYHFEYRCSVCGHTGINSANQGGGTNTLQKGYV